MHWTRIAAFSSLLLACACASPARKALFPYTEEQVLAKDVLEFHEDRFLLEHNEKLAQCWKDYVEARDRLAGLWKARKQLVSADPEKQQQADQQIRQAKQELMAAARRLQEQSLEMAGEAEQLLRAAGRIPPILGAQR